MLLIAYSKKRLLANCVLFQNPNEKGRNPILNYGTGGEVSHISEGWLLRRKRYFVKNTAHWPLDQTVTAPEIKASSDSKWGITLGIFAPTVTISEFETPRMGVTFKTKSGAFRQETLPWGHLEIKPNTPQSPARRSGSSASHTTLFQPMGGFPIVKPLSPPFHHGAETRRDFSEHWVSLSPNLGDLEEPERPLPQNPKLAPPRAERETFGETEYVSRKRAVAPSPYTRTRRTKKASIRHSGEQITPPASEAEKERIRRIFRTY